MCEIFHGMWKVSWLPSYYQLMMYTEKVAVCREIRTKHTMQSEHHVEFWILNLVVRKETDRLWNVNLKILSTSVITFV
jgi:hypothetical protein